MRAQIYIQMRRLNEYEIPFYGLKEGVHHFEYKIEKQFFDDFNYHEFLNNNLVVKLEFVKKTTLLELYFNVNGTVEVLCDITNEPFNESVKGKLDLVVKFGEEFKDEGDEIVIIPYGQHQFNVAQYIYEMIVLAVPVKKTHPGIKEGTLKSDILDKLEELKPKEKNNLDKIDPRWEDLKKLITDKKD